MILQRFQPGQIWKYENHYLTEIIEVGKNYFKHKILKHDKANHLVGKICERSSYVLTEKINNWELFK